MSEKVAILGCGPAGLAAAQAVVSSGREAVIVSNTDQPSKLYGCQYLHAPVPGYEHVTRVRVSYRLHGTARGYRQKVYGYRWAGTVSPEDFVGDHDAWDIRQTYELLWKNLVAPGNVQFIKRRVVKGSIPFVTSLDPELIVSTIPAQALCSNPNHEFLSHTIWADGSTTAAQGYAPNSVVCDGTPHRPWYRISNVFGYHTTEWAEKPPHFVKAVPVVKPLSTDCDCHPEVLRAGRYGAWEKKRLVHEVYPAVTEVLNARA